MVPPQVVVALVCLAAGLVIGFVVGVLLCASCLPSGHR